MTREKTEGPEGPGGQTRKKLKDLSACEREERGREEGGRVYATLMEKHLFTKLRSDKARPK